MTIITVIEGLHPFPEGGACSVDVSFPCSALLLHSSGWSCVLKRDAFRSAGGSGCPHLTLLPTADVCWLGCTSWLIWKHIPLSHLYSATLLQFQTLMCITLAARLF